jgi:hypothetical protein
MVRILRKKGTDSERVVVESKMILFVFSWNSELPRFFFFLEMGDPLPLHQLMHTAAFI